MNIFKEIMFAIKAVYYAKLEQYTFRKCFEFAEKRDIVKLNKYSDLHTKYGDECLRQTNLFLKNLIKKG